MKLDYIYKNIIRQMNKNKENQQQISDLLGIAPITLRCKLEGKFDWKKKEIDILCEHYNMNYHELFKKEN